MVALRDRLRPRHRGGVSLLRALQLPRRGDAGHRIGGAQVKKSGPCPARFPGASKCDYLLLEPELGEVSLFGVVLGVELGLLLELELEPMLPEVLPEPWLAPLAPPDVPPDALLEWPAFHSSRLIWPSWFLSSLSNSLSLLAPDEALEPPEELEPPAALLEDLPLEPEAPDVALGVLELEPPAAELWPEDEDEGLVLCDIEGEDDWPLFCFAASSAYADAAANARSEKPSITDFIFIKNLPPE
jgi:hypothetical protein